MKTNLSCKGSFTGLGPDGSNLLLYLLDFLLVSASFVVGYLGFQFVDLLLVLPVRTPRDNRNAAAAG